MDLKAVFTSEVIGVAIKLESDDDVLRYLVEKLVNGNQIYDSQSISNLLLEESALRASLVGHGAGIIHSRWDRLQKPIGSLVILKPGESISLGEQVKFKVRAVFLVISPFKPAELHLDLISSIALLVRTKGTVESLCQCEKSHEVLEILDQFSKSSNHNGD